MKKTAIAAFVFLFVLGAVFAADGRRADAVKAEPSRLGVTGSIAPLDVDVHASDDLSLAPADALPAADRAVGVAGEASGLRPADADAPSDRAQKLDALLRRLSEGPSAMIGVDLPEKSFAPQIAKRLKRARLLWINADYFNERGVALSNDGLTPEVQARFLDAFGWGIPRDSDPSGAFTQEERVVHADRYGGGGIGLGTGSGRGALYGRVFAKGMGRTTLAQKKGKNHINGGLPVEEGMREAIWGEVNQDAPHGASRVIALIDRGTWSRDPEKGLQRDVIAIRETDVRPANFLIPWFALQDDADDIELGHIGDAAPFFKKALPAPRKAAESAEHGIKEGLFEYIDRVAQQHAFLFARKLFHGAPSESNIGLGGKLTDYGTQTAQPGYGRIRILKHSGAAGDAGYIASREVVDFINGIYFLPEEREKELPKQDKAIERFQRAYIRSLLGEFVLLTGLPPEIMPKLVRRVDVGRLAALIVHVATAGAVQVGKDRVPQKLQRYELGSLLVRLAGVALDPDAALWIAMEEIPGFTQGELRVELVEEYVAVMRAATELRPQGTTTQQFFETVARNAALLNRKMPELYRWRMKEEHRDAIVRYNRTGDASRIRAEIDRRIRAWRSEAPPALERPGPVVAAWRRLVYRAVGIANLYSAVTFLVMALALFAWAKLRALARAAVELVHESAATAEAADKGKEGS